MKVLYAIQGTGNGHVSRAMDLIPIIQKYCDVDLLISGYQSDIKLPFPIRYRYHGLSFIFGKKGGIDFWNTYTKASFKTLRKEIQECPVEDYDFVINDFEPVSAWACSQKKVPCIALSHQAAVLDKKAPKPKWPNPLGRLILKYYAPSNMQFGIHFGKYSKNMFTPVIRDKIRNSTAMQKNHYTVYLPAYSDAKLLEVLKEINIVEWQVFSKHAEAPSATDNVRFYPVNNEQFIESMTSAKGVLCGAGFETPAEAMHLGKKLMVIPMKSQYEQQCNAAALKELGVPVLQKLNKKKVKTIRKWVDSDYLVNIVYNNSTQKMIKTVFETHVQEILRKKEWKTTYSLIFEQEARISKIV